MAGKQAAVRILALATLGLFGIGMAHISANYGDPHAGVMLTLAGMVTGVLAFWLARTDETAGIRFGEWPHAVLRRGWAAGLGLALILILGIRVTGSWIPDWLSIALSDSVRLMLLRPPDDAEQLGLWLVGTGLLLWGLTPAGEWRALRADFREARARRGGVLAALFLITALALVVRIANLGGAVEIMVGDEGPFGSSARMLAEGRMSALLFAPAHLSHPWLFAYLLSPFVSLMGPTLAAIRLFPAIIGALTTPAVVWLGRELFDWRVGVAGGLFLATYPVHVHFSRLALNNIVDPFFIVLAFALLLYGLRKGRRGPLILAGGCLGWSQYFYAGARLAPPLLAGFVIFLGLRYPRAMRERSGAILAMILAFLAVTWPANAYLLSQGMPLTTRVEAVYAWGGEADWPTLVRAQFVPAFMAFIHTHDAYLFYGGYTPLLLPLSAVAFLAGVAYLGRRILAAQAQAVLLLAWLVSTAVFGGAMLQYVPGYARYVIALPAVALTVAVGIIRLWDAALRPLALRWTVLLVLPLVVVNGVYYFGTHVITHLDHVPPHGWQQYDIARRLASLEDDTVVHLIVSDRQFSQHQLWMVDYFCGPREIAWHQGVPGTLPGDLAVPVPRPPLAFFVTPDRLDVLDHLQRLFPGGMVIPNSNTYFGVSLLTLFYVPRSL